MAPTVGVSLSFCLAFTLLCHPSQHCRPVTYWGQCDSLSATVLHWLVVYMYHVHVSQHVRVHISRTTATPAASARRGLIVLSMQGPYKKCISSVLSRSVCCASLSQIHCSKYLREQIFKAIYLEIYWEKPFQIVVLFSWISLLDNAVVAEKKLAKLYFLHNPEGSHPQNTSVSEQLRSWTLPFQTRSNTITLFIVKSVAGMATDLTIKYANFAILNIRNITPFHGSIMLRQLCSLKCFEQCISCDTG